MSKIILFIATSLDGYIASADGGIDWLFTDGDYGYAEFYAGIGYTLTGKKTFDQILTLGEFPYPGKQNFVFSRKKGLESTKDVTFIHEDPAAFTKKLKAKAQEDIWLVGGSEIIQSVDGAGLVDEYVISIHPVILGEGIPLFRNRPAPVNLTLRDTTSFSSGLVQLRYSRNA